MDDIDSMEIKDHYNFYSNSFQRIFCEFMLENIFYRKDSKFKSHTLEQDNKEVMKLVLVTCDKFNSHKTSHKSEKIKS